MSTSRERRKRTRDASGLHFATGNVATYASVEIIDLIRAEAGRRADKHVLPRWLQPPHARAPIFKRGRAIEPHPDKQKAPCQAPSANVIPDQGNDR